MTTSAPSVANTPAAASTNTTSSAASTVAASTASSNGIVHAAATATAQQQLATAAAATAAAAATTARAMQSDEDFNIRFVNLVRSYKCLYDKKVPEYRNRDNQEKAWSLISQETRESVIHCKERWRNLRACLSRYIKQQSGTDPQHKPYYLTEHMAFLLPFLKSTRNHVDSSNGHNSLATLFQISLAQQQQPSATLHVLPPHMHFNEHHQLEMKQSLSDNEDEETIDAFDPAVTANLQLQRSIIRSPPLSDTASANTLQNFIPDVQLAELRTPDAQQMSASARRESRDCGHEPKRIKTECHEATTTAQLHMYSSENSDMEFFRSILPDIAALTPQQKRKFKIGILELIDDVVERFPAERSAGSSSGGGSSGRQQRRSSAREWRK